MNQLKGLASFWPSRPGAERLASGEDSTTLPNTRVTFPEPISATSYRQRNGISYSPPAGYPPAPTGPPQQPGTVPWTPRTLQTKFVYLVTAAMIGISIGIEIAYSQAIKHNGFKVDKIDQFGGTQFLSSFVPVIIAVPLSSYWMRYYQEVLRIQPYVNIAQGNTTPQHGLLLDYVNLSRIQVIFRSLRLKDRLVLFCTFLYFLSLLFQPLAAALFVIRNTQFYYSSSVQSTAFLGLRDDFMDLNAFAAAAGYVQAAVSGLIDPPADPPFVWESFSMATFNTSIIRDTITKNGSVIIDTVATSTNPNCARAQTSAQLLSNGSYTIIGNYSSCQVQVTVDPGVREPFGVSIVDNCDVNGVVPDDKFKPVMFWFFSFNGPWTDMVFCLPTVQIYRVTSNISVSDNLLKEVNLISPWTGTSNVTSGPPLRGLAMNGLYFDPPPDIYVEARGVSIRSGLPGSIFRYVNKTIGIDTALQLADGLLPWVNSTYRQYLAISAKSNFFLDLETQNPALFVAWEPRLFLDTYAAHLFSSLFLTVAVLACLFQVAHSRKRRQLRLAGPVGSIASVVSLTSAMNMGQLLNAKDTEQELERKLQGLRCGIDKESLGIIVQNNVGENTALLRAP